jgi:hypothetical protein
MNPTGRLALRFGPRLTVVPFLLLAASASTFGQIPDAAKKAPNPDAALIQQQIDSAVKNLTSDDPEKQAAGRDALAKGVEMSDATAQASPQYLDAYAAAVAKALTPLTQHEDMRVRLNAAIANARVAEKAGNTRLDAVTIKFINDKTSAVALWGVKAARSMLSAELGRTGKQPLAEAVVGAVQRFMVGPIINEVYDALALNVFGTQGRQPPAVIKAAIPHMLRVYRMRVDGYAAAVPPDPSIDNTAAEFLSFATVWQQMTPAQRTEAIQGMSDLISFAGQYAQLMEGDERTGLLTVFKRTGAALQVVGDATKNQGLANAAREVQKVSSGMDGTEVVQRTDALTSALRQAFAGLKESPKLQIAPEPAEAGSNQAAPGPEGKAPPTPSAGGNTTPTRGNQPKSAAPTPDLDTAQEAGSSAPADAGKAPPPAPAPQRPAPTAR